MSGYESNRFINLAESVAKHLICCICLNIYNNAVMSECEHTFCKSCVENWIRNNHKECPECRTEFTTRMDSNSKLKCVFKHNLLANNMINELIIKCDNQSNGCQEVVELGLLSTHLNICEHWLCPKCEFIGRSEGHECLEFMKKKFNEMMNEMIKLRDRNSLLEKEIKTIKRSEVGANNNLRDIESELKSSEIINPLESGLNEQKTTLSAQRIYFGTHLSLYSEFGVNSNRLHFLVDSENSKNLSLKIESIEELKFCSDSSFPAYILRLNYHSCYKLRNFIQLRGASKCWFSTRSEDSKQRYIIIKLWPKRYSDTPNIMDSLINLPLISAGLKCEAIGLNETKRMFNAFNVF